MGKITLNIEADHVDELRSTLKQLLNDSNQLVKVEPVNIPVNPKSAKADPEQTVMKIVEAPTPMPAIEVVDAPAPAAPKTRQTRKKADDGHAANGTNGVASGTPVSEPEQVQADAPKPEQPKKASKVQGAIVEGPSAEALNMPALAHMPDSIKNAQNMRELLTWLADNGAPDIDTLVNACMAVKGQVAILQKVPDIDSRVRRAAEVLGLFAPADEADNAAG